MTAMANIESIKLEGLTEVCWNLRRLPAEATDAALGGLKKAGLHIIADAQENLRHNKSVVTGLLRQSGKVEVNKARKEVTVGFFDTRNRKGYAAYVEYGRRAGKFPPLDMIQQWLYKKFRITDERELRSRTFLTARKIAREGTQPHPFFKPALDKNRNRIVKAVVDAIDNFTR